MEPRGVTYKANEYIQTPNLNKVSRKAITPGAQNIVCGGKSIISTDAVVRGDLRRAGAGQVVVQMGKNCVVSPRTVLRPPYKVYKGKFSYYPMKIGDYVFMDEDSVIESAQIGNYVHIGKNCVIGRFSIIKDCVLIADDTVIPPYTVVPPFSVYGGSPGTFVQELPESAQEMLRRRAIDYFDKFVPEH